MTRSEGDSQLSTVLRSFKIKWEQVEQILLKYFTIIECFIDILPSEYGGPESIEEMSAKWVDVVTQHRDILLELDEMSIRETAIVKKTKEKKSSLWNIFSSYGSQASGESL